MLELQWDTCNLQREPLPGNSGGGSVPGFSEVTALKVAGCSFLHREIMQRAMVSWMGVGGWVGGIGLCSQSPYLCL